MSCGKTSRSTKTPAVGCLSFHSQMVRVGFSPLLHWDPFQLEPSGFCCGSFWTVPDGTGYYERYCSQHQQVVNPTATRNDRCTFFQPVVTCCCPIYDQPNGVVRTCKDHQLTNSTVPLHRLHNDQHLPCQGCGAPWWDSFLADGTTS